MKNKTLRRAFRKYLDVSDVEELRGLLAELEKGFTAYQASGATRAFVENFMEFIENLDSAMEDLDRVIEIRDRSLAVSSRELTSLNRQITEQAVKQKAVLEELKRTVHVLQ